MGFVEFKTVFGNNGLCCKLAAVVLLTAGVKVKVAADLEFKNLFIICVCVCPLLPPAPIAVAKFEGIRTTL